MAYTSGSSSGAQILTDDDDIFPAHVNELRQSNLSSFVVGKTVNSQYYCDGTADDVQIQQALDAASTAGGGIVFVKEGIYDITAILTIPSNTILQGVGWKTILKASVTLNSVITNKDTTNGNVNIIIRDLMVDGNYLAGVSSASPLGYDTLIYFRALDNVCTGCKVINCKVVKSYDGGGIGFTDVGWVSNTPGFTPLSWTGCEISRCWIEDIGIGSLQVSSGNAKGINLLGTSDIDIYENYIKDVASQCIVTNTSKYCNIHNNTIWNNVTSVEGGEGIFLSYNSAYCRVSNNIVGSSTDVSSFAIGSLYIAGYTQDLGNNVISDNIIYQCYHGIYDNGGARDTITGNVISGAVLDGITLNGTTAQYNIVSNNVIYDVSGVGIRNTSSNNIIDSNSIYSPVGYGIYSICGSANITNVTISNNHIIDSGGAFGLLVYEGSSAKNHSDVTISGNYISGATSHLVKINAKTGSRIKILDNTLISTVADSDIIYLDDGNKITISGNQVDTDGRGIRISTGISDVMVENNFLDTSATTNLIYEVGTANNNIIMGNNVRNIGSGGTAIVTLGANSVVRNNLGWVTEASGTTTIGGTATAATVTHGLSVTPTGDDIMVTPMTTMGSASYFYTSTYGATSFNINTNIAPVGTVTFGWKAIVL